MDITLKFGATISSANYILLTFSSEFIRNDGGTLTCADYTTGTEVTKDCTTTDASNVIATVQVNSFCASTCSNTNTYVLRLKNVVNRFYVDAFSGTLLIETRVDTTSLISTVTYSLSQVSILTPGILLNSAVARSVATQGSTSAFTLTWTTPGYLISGSVI